MPQDLEKAYDPGAIEDRWAAYWVNERLFEVPSPESVPERDPFTILLPPPNVTGRLHMGHMLNQTEMDILTRWHRMCGDTTLWLPGTDHAGIATQMMVERQLAGEGKKRQDVGREAFIERVWQWKEHYGGAILGQMKRLGASVDWSREYFTMDENLSVAVREAFVRLYEQGLIYRGKYIVNWDPIQQTAVSDLEVTHEERAGKLYHIRYPLADGSGSIVIATTRPETMLGDTAVAVNPDDARYLAFHGKLLRLPLSGVNGGAEREIPIVTDSWANPEFGTGAVKVTPAHDPNDFAIGVRHNLPQLSIMDEAARIELPGSPYHGLDRYAAREKIVEDLRALDLLVDVKDHAMAIGLSQRSGAVVEPRLSTQWFVKIQPLADKAIAAVEQGHIKFTPEQYAKTYFEWMRNIHDWCISRQLWWGHRIPAWHCEACGQITVSRADKPASCAECGSAAIHQDTDVLDTWFSSGLLPCSVFGWPKHTRDLDIFYPTSLLVTGFDILFFWVARMIMLGCHFMLEMPMANGDKRTLKDAVPFREVYIHALVRDADRQKMSKTKGNVIDPIEIVEKYGTDAVRFTLAAMASPGTDIAFSEARTEGYRAFANKIWNAARFIFMNEERAALGGVEVSRNTLIDSFGPDENAPIEARWIVSRLNHTAADVNEALSEYRFHEAANLVYQFFWGDFCDWYLEIVKLRLDFTENADKRAAKAALTTLLATFEAALRMLSPFMPFITEELWHALYNGNPPAKSIALSRYPQPFDEALDLAVESEMATLQDLIVNIRAARKELEVPERESVPVRVRTTHDNSFGDALLIIQRLARVSTLDPVENIEGSGIRSTPAFDVQVVYERTVDVAAERERLTKELAQFEKEQANAQRQLANEGFLAKAPAHIVDGIRKRAAELVILIEKTRRSLDQLG
ncbi:valyl-tRNA synthetase [Silvibacterium bohemicum]|uniref:Valine--tRNA ligase n=1 Tax=Silvibacterium bohemicum TaxID=1577686 RepID=A0A841K9X2_9BACT|nr:valine--tRNA ligase [Silvibacterium bohemicum]MBB6147084.1 valyl-tRNA synthetase [Silvibacterium bohemicum]